MQLRNSRALTYVELLVIIAVVAVLVALILPVFATSRESADNENCFYNMKQVGLGLKVYTQDYDERYPRQDYCADSAPSPLNPNAQPGCTGPFGQRINHYKWPAYLLPYISTVETFSCPRRERPELEWNTNGEIWNGYALNLSVTGSLNTYGNPNRRGAYRDSFLGGTYAGLDTPAETMLIMEHWFPGVWTYVTPNAVHQTAYPLATREVLERTLTRDGWVDRRAYNHRYAVAFGDGHIRGFSADGFLSLCPPAAEYTVSSVPNPFPAGLSWTISKPPVWKKPWPLWWLK